MIIKGNRHSNGAKLADYLMDGGRHGERVAEPELYGFIAENIFDAFRDVHTAAGVRAIEFPLFHIQIRLPQQDHMTRAQWDETAARTLKTAGLEGQPYAQVFHTDEKTGEMHMHLAVSTIDQHTHHAKPLPFYKLRFKDLARKLENEFDLTRVKNHRDGPIKYAATRSEEQQAQRHGFKKEAVRSLIRQCWDATERGPQFGHGFDNALADAGLILTPGDRRGWVVLDHKGGIHALGERILGISASAVNARLADLDRANMPTVEQAKEFMLDLPKDRVEKLTRELAEVQKQIEVEKEYARRDPVRAEIQWQEALEKAAIAKEEKERRFVEPERHAPAGPARPPLTKEQPKEETRAGREQGTPGSRKERQWPINPPQLQSWPGFDKAATEATRDERTQDLRGPAAQIWAAWCEIDKDAALTPAQEEEARRLGVTIHEAREKVIASALAGKTVSFSVPLKEVFAASLDDRGISFAAVTKEEAERSHREAEFAKAVGHYAPRFKQGEIVIITEQRSEYRRDGEAIATARVHKLDQSLAEKFTKHLGIRSQLQGIDATLKHSDERMQQRRAERETTRLERAIDTKLPLRVTAKRTVSKATHGLHKSAAAIEKTASIAASFGKIFDVVGSLVEGIAAPKLTPQQIHEGEKAKDRREAEADFTIDLSRITAEAAQQRQRENEREAARQRQRDDGGGRER